MEEVLGDVAIRDQADRVSRRALIRTGGGAAALGILGAAASAAPAAAAGFGYTPVPPYRTFDTRGGEKLGVGHYVEFDVLTDVYNSSRIPSSATAVTYNLTVTETWWTGWLVVWPAGGTKPSVSTINWIGSGLTLANGGTVGLGVSSFGEEGSIAVGCETTGGAPYATHFIVDITGYFS